ncbi:plastocyanin/azurin family copper-binding protein [Halobacteria archaeon AArc-dxtr1]|nr:plastocyanin/azurin family copper-binding protein [Halobacteria archaeon AArc-dxtr1]
MADYTSRRTLLKLTGGAGSLALLAGCLGDDDENGDDANGDDDGNGDDDHDHDDGNGDDNGEPEPAIFEVSELDPDSLTITEGDEIDVSATITNTGEQDGEQDIELRVDDDTLAVEDVSLDADGEETVSFEGVATEEFEADGYTYGVHSDDDEETGTLTVQEAADPDDAYFEVSDLDPEAVTVDPGDEIDVSATVTNTGEQDGTQDIELRIDGDAVDSQELTLEPEASESVSFEGVGTDDLVGEYSYGVYSSNDNVTGTLTVEDPFATIELEGDRSAWVGVAPDQIAGEENPTLELHADQEYTLEWENVDGMFHNFEIETEGGDTLVSTDGVSGEGETETVTFTATDDMAEYLCMPHPLAMRGEIDVE